MNRYFEEKLVDPFRLAREQTTLKGSFPIEEMSRFAAMVVNACSQVGFAISFKTGAQGNVLIDGDIKAQVSLNCQRCGQDYIHSINSCFNLSPIDKATSLVNLKIPDSYEPTYLEKDGKISVKCLVEDELILSLPIIAKHSAVDASCKNENLSVQNVDSKNIAVDNTNPFKILEKFNIKQTLNVKQRK